MLFIWDVLIQQFNHKATNSLMHEYFWMVVGGYIWALRILQHGDFSIFGDLKIPALSDICSRLLKILFLQL